MAAPTVALAVKAAVTAATDKRIWKTAAVVVTAALMPLILTVLLLMSFLSGGAAHHVDAVQTVFHGGALPDGTPVEYRQRIADMQDAFGKLDQAVSKLDIANGSLDSTRVKAVFYSLYFGADSLPNIDTNAFVGCFVKTEARTRAVTNPDGTKNQQTYTILVPLTDLSVVYQNLGKFLDRAVTDDEKTNAGAVYQQALGIDLNQSSSSPPQMPSVGGLISPIGSNWRSLVTSEFGPRIDPINGKATVHTGIDFGVPTGTQVHAAKDGTVTKVAWNPDGYGNYLMIDHGGGLVTLYGHCPKILVSVGRRVKTGDVVALSGDTGHSTGSHLHFEVRVNGQAVNPRRYLP